MKRYLYLLHFIDEMSHAQHYIGITADIERRFREHFRGTGSAITRAFADRKIGFTVAAVWQCTSTEPERFMKKQKNGRLYCPLCRPYTNRRITGIASRVPLTQLTRSGIQLTYLHKDENECSEFTA